MTVAPSSRSSRSGPPATSAGRPRVRDRIAVCEVGPPSAVARPSTRLVSRCAVSDGDRSLASRMQGLSGRCSRLPLARLGSIWVSTRRPTSRRSLARPASTALPSADSLLAMRSTDCCQDQATPWPSTISWQARVIRSVSLSSSAWARKIAASPAPSRRRVSSSIACNCWRVRSSASCSSAPPSLSGTGASGTGPSLPASLCTTPIARPGLAPMPTMAGCACGGVQPVTGAARRCAAACASAFSWAVRPSMTLRSRASAAAASWPSAEMVTVSPACRPNCSSDTRFLASPVCSPARTWIRAAKPRAVSTQRVAGRACRPVG